MSSDNVDTFASSPWAPGRLREEDRARGLALQPVAAVRALRVVEAQVALQRPLERDDDSVKNGASLSSLDESRPPR